MINGKFILQGTIELISPAIIGSGKSDYTDIDVLLDGYGKPFIPATSFVGVLRYFFGDEDSQKDFWGFSEGQAGQQSALCCSDLCCNGNAEIVIRDGIKIDSKTGIVKKGAKYDYQVIESGAKFELNLEVGFTDKTRDDYRKMMSAICHVLKGQKISIGAKTNSGFGKIKLSDEKLFEFDYKKKEDVLMWLKRDFSNPINLQDNERFDVGSKEFIIDADFILKNSLIVRSYPSDPAMPDAVHIKTKGEYVLPGTSLKGAIRSRAERILNTIEKSQNILTNLFGDVNEDTKTKIKGRISVDETVLPEFSSELQTRIKIDRFTGGTIETALFETIPLFSDGKDDKHVKVKITIRDYEKYEAGLMLMVLKDLWTGDLAVGGEKNVGRGVFKGVHADISWNGKVISLPIDIKGLEQSAKTELEKFVSALKDYKEKTSDGK